MNLCANAVQAMKSPARSRSRVEAMQFDRAAVRVDRQLPAGSYVS